MPAGLRNRGYLDPEMCWKEWCIHSGSLKATQEKFYSQGIRNPRNDEPPTKSGIEKAAFFWAIQNQDEARKDLEYAWLKEGQVLTDERWKKFLASASRLVFFQRPRRHEEFLHNNGLAEYI